MSSDLSKENFQLGVTAGIACLEGVDKPREVMARTSIAYQAARKTERALYVNTKEIQKHLMDDQEILAAFPQALAAGGEFVVYYQPKVRIADKKHIWCGGTCTLGEMDRWSHLRDLFRSLRERAACADLTIICLSRYAVF